MKTHEIAAAYDSLTHLWEHPKFNRQNGIGAHKRALSFAKVEGLALDVGCGCTGRFIELFLASNYTPMGIDLSANMLSLARARHPQITFIHDDVLEHRFETRFDFISAWDCIWHMPLSLQRPLMEKLVSLLSPNGVLIFSFGGTDEACEDQDSTMGPRMNYASLGVSGLFTLLIELDCHIRHFEFDQHPEVHAYMIVQKKN